MRIITICTILLSVCVLNISCSFRTMEQAYQRDVDVVRLEHIVYWSKLIEEYKGKTGHYPLQDSLPTDTSIGLVRILTNNQLEYYTKGSDKYRPDLDNNSDGFFNEFTIKSLIREFEKGIGREIDEMYDVQKIPTANPIGYFYFVEKNGYLLWVTCISCGVTPISTLLLDGKTPTVNIVSEKMKDRVEKSLTYSEMISHPIFKEWINRKITRNTSIRNIEQENLHNSKK